MSTSGRDAMTMGANGQLGGLRGAGGGGGRAPVESTDTLRSTQRAEIVDLLGEGKIGGLVNGLRSVYLDGVPVENADGSRNFDAFGFDLVDGGPADERAHDFGDVQTEVAVGVTVLAAVPVVRTIADTTVDSVRVTIQVPALVQARDNGDRVGSSFEWAVDVQSAGGGFVERYRDEVAGKASSLYQRSVRVSLADVGPAPWDVRVRRITPDATSANTVNAFAWGSYTAISGVRMLYRHSAAAKLGFDAKSFSAIPTRAYDVLGIDDWEIPSNYDPLARTTTGVWNGTFKPGWTNNPAWILYGLIRHQRYGLGEYVTQPPDKWTLYALQQWCDGRVPDGRGGMEPRYTINAYLQNKVEAVRMLQDICAVFRGVLLYGAGELGATWDAPAEPVHVYGPANVVDGLFTYAQGSVSGKKSACTCWYTDRSQFGKRVPVTWSDPELVAKYGLRPMEIDPIGVASESQALRMAKWALYTTENEDATVTFRLGAQGQPIRIGQVFAVNDPAETGERLSGRVSAATASSVTLDAPVTLVVGDAYKLWITLQDPADPTRLIAEARDVVNAPGEHGTIAVSPAFSTVPMVETMWLLEGQAVRPTLWRYVGVQEVTGDDGALQYEVTGLRTDPGKYALIEANQPLEERPTRRLSDRAPPPRNVAVDELVYVQDSAVKVRATVSWEYPAPGLRYAVEWRLSLGPWNLLVPTSSNTVDLDAAPGFIEVKVRSLSALGIDSHAVYASRTLVGLVTLPDPVQGVGAENVAGGMRVFWDASADRAYLEHELRQGATFAASTFVWKGSATEHTWTPPAAGAYQVWVAQRDRAGNVSESVGLSWVYEPVAGGGAGSAALVLYRRTTASVPPAVPAGELVFEFAGGTLTGALDGWSRTRAAGGGQYEWETRAYAYSAGASDTIASAEWSQPVLVGRNAGNLLDPSAWVLGSNGSQPGFGASGPASENLIALLETPDGSTAPVWHSVSSESVAGEDPDGGWNTGLVTIDRSKTYRFSVWLRTGGAAGGSFYMGPAQNESAEVQVCDFAGVPIGNPYFAADLRSKLVSGKWYLLVGYVHPSTATAGDASGLAGVYDGDTGIKLATILGYEVRWGPMATATRQRVYQYYAPSGAEQDFFRPRIDVCDGSEQSLQELLAPAFFKAVTRAQATANGKSAVFWQSGEPSGADVDDLWVNTGMGNRLSRWTGSAWAAEPLGASALSPGAAAEVLPTLVSTRPYPVSSNKLIAVDVMSVTPDTDCYAEVTIVFQGQTSDEWDSGPSYFAICKYERDDPGRQPPLNPPFEGLNTASMSSLELKARTTSPSVRANCTIAARFPLSRGVAYLLGLAANGSQIFQGPAFLATVFACTIDVTLVKR